MSNRKSFSILMASGESEQSSLAFPHPSPPNSAFLLEENGELKRVADQRKYDVFINFRGKDTRKNFTDHLYTALNQKGIITFKDDQNLVKGNTISQEILQGIECSRVSVVIFSKTYASSVCCLDELERIYMCLKAQRLTVLPAFYHVQISQVREQTGAIGEAFAMHEEDLRDNIEKVQRWRAAMTEVSELSGWDLQDRCESEVVQEIVEHIMRILRSRPSIIAKELVGIDSYVEEISLYIGAGLDDVRILGICGMSGIGKTTIARVFYEKMSAQFEGGSFLANVREVEEKYGLVNLQEQFLSEILMERNIRVWDTYKGTNEIKNRLCRKRVLIILDNVDRLDQLQSLVGKRDWFGSGSRIIITTRDEHLLVSHGADKIVRIEGLNPDDALQLLSLKAFRCDHPAKEFLELCNHFINYSNGLPLALEVLGSFLFGRSVNEWKSTLDRLKEIPNKEILDKLEISFAGLEETEKKIFLDIACFFKGKNKAHVTKVLECCGLYPDIGMKVLIEKSLIYISENRVWMHDLLQEMGQEIVKRSSQEPGKRSRLWLYQDVYHVFLENTGTEEVEGIVLELTEQENRCLSAKAFSKMKRLRMLKLRNFFLSEGLEYLSSELQYLEWYRYPFKSFPSDFRPYKLVELKICRSQIQQLWKEINPLEKLKFIDLSYSMNIRKTPDFRMFPHLETLNLKGCTKLIEIHPSIGILKRLDSLNLKDCKSLKCLPGSICNLECLKILQLSGCAKLSKLPERLGNIICLEELYLGRTGVRELPSSITLLKSLQVLSFRGCKGPPHKSWDMRLLPRKSPCNIAFMLPSLFALHHVKEIDLSDCSLTEEIIPNDLSGFFALEKLNLSGNDFLRLPASIHRLSNLKSLVVDKCKRLEYLPELPPGIEYVGMHDCTSLVALPNALEAFKSSKVFTYAFTNCFNLTKPQGNMGVWWRFRRELYLLLKTLPQELFHFSMCLPGGGSPGWFNFQGVGNSVRIHLPPYWCCNSNWKGFAVSSLFVIHERAINNDDDVLSNEDGDSKFAKLQCFLLSNNEKLQHGPYTLLLPKDSFPTLNQHWFIYLPKRLYSQTFSSRGLEVKKCGVRLVYEQDVEELNPDNLLK